MIKQFKPASNRAVLFAIPALASVLAILTFTAAADKRPAKAPPTEKASTPKEQAAKHARGIELLQKELDEQTARVHETESLVDQLRKQLGIPPVATEFELFSAESDLNKKVESDLIRVQQEYAQYDRLLSNLKSKSRSELIQMIPTAYADDALNRLLQDLRGAEQRMAKAKVDYDDAHPEVRRAAAELKEIDRQIEARVSGIIAGLEAVTAARKAIVEELKKKTSESVKVQNDRAEAARPYFRALRDLETYRKLRDSLLIRLVQERIDAAVEP